MSERGTPMDDDAIVGWLRQVLPYFRKHRHKTFVVYLDGAAPRRPIERGYQRLIHRSQSHAGFKPAHLALAPANTASGPHSLIDSSRNYLNQLIILFNLD